MPARLTKHTCGSCGKFRSATYCQSHPLAEGEVPKPSLCRKCVHGQTSSGESDRSYEKYVKEQKRRRRRQLREMDDQSYERYRKDQRRRCLSSADDSYEKYRETRSYHRRRKGYTEPSEDSGYWSYEEPTMRACKVVYVDRSDSRRCTHSSSGGRSAISVSFKREVPRQLRRKSRSRSSAEEIRVIRSIIREPALPRSRSKERPYQHRYRSETRSEGSVRFDLPPREREPRKYRAFDYDGESGPYEPMRHCPLHGRSDATEVHRDLSGVDRHRARFKDTSGPVQGYPGRVVTREEKMYRVDPSQEQMPRPLSRSSIRRIEAPHKDRYTTDSRDLESPDMAFVAGARGRSLSSERRSINRLKPDQADGRQRSRSRSSYRGSTSSDEIGTIMCCVSLCHRSTSKVRAYKLTMSLIRTTFVLSSPARDPDSRLPIDATFDTRERPSYRACES